MATMAANNGPVNSSAMALAKGVMVIAKKNDNMETVCTEARSACRCRLRVRNGAQPRRQKAGRKISPPKRRRKKPISNGCMPVDAT